MPAQLFNFWQPNKSYPQGTFIFDGLGDIQEATIGGVSGSSAPAWNSQSHIGGSPPAPIFTTQDGTVTWTFIGLGSKVVALQRLQDPIGPYDQSLNDAVSFTRGTLDSGKFVTLNSMGMLDPSMGGGSAGGGVSNFNGRTGAVIPQFGDYSFSLISGTITVAQLGSVEGTGSKVQLTNQGATTNNDVVTYDGSGNVKDSGVLITSLALTSQLPQTFTPVAGEFLTGYNASTETFSAGTAFYQVVQEHFNTLPQENRLNFLSPFNVVDDPSNSSTDVSFVIQGGTGINVVLSGSPPSIITVVNTGVISINGLTGTPSVVSGGAGISVAPSGGNIVVNNTGVTSFNGSVGAVTGVASLNGETGAVTLVAGSNITITPSGQNITIASSGGGGGGGGGVNEQNSNYTAVTGDMGKTIVFNTLSNVTLTLPNPPPSTTWWIYVQNINTGIVDISGNGLLIDNSFDTFGSPPVSALPLMQNEGVYITTDGTNYFTERGLSNGGVNPQTANYTAVGADDGKLISFNTGSAATLTLPAVPPSTDWVIDVEEIDGGSLTINPNGNLLDGSASSLILTNNAAGAAPAGDTYVLGTPDTPNLPNSVANPSVYYGPDVQPAVAGSLDDEFNGSVLNTTTRWTWFNQTTATATVANSQLTLVVPASAGTSANGITQPAPATPWTIITKITGMNLAPITPFPTVGVVLMDGTGKFVFCGFSFRNSPVFSGSTTAAVMGISVDYYTNATTYSGTSPYPGSVTQATFPWWIKAQDNGTNLIFSFSQNGSVYYQILSVSRTAFLTAGPTLVGISSGSDGSNTVVHGSFDYFRRTQ